MNDHALSPEFMDALQRETFDYFVHEANPRNGLIADKTQRGSPASIAAVGLALSSYPVGVERGFLGRRDAVERTLATLRFFWAASRGRTPTRRATTVSTTTFSTWTSGRRVWDCELSTIDSAFLLAGMLTAAAYFAGDGADEREMRELAERSTAARIGTGRATAAATVTHGWKPESGFLRSAGTATTRR